MGFLDVKFDEGAILELPESQQAQALTALKEFRDLRRNNFMLGYNPLGHQHEIHLARQRKRAMMGGNRAGKTTGGVADDLIEMVPRELLPSHLLEYKRPDWECPRFVRCCAPSTKLLNGVLIQKFREMTPKALLKGGRFSNSFNLQTGMLHLECGCFVEFMSYEMDLDKFGGTARHRIHYDEEPPEDIRDECYARLIDFGGIELFTMTPLLGMTWMYDDIWLPAEEEHNQGKVFAIAASMEDNYHLDRDAVEEAKGEWEGDEQYEARIHGHFIHFGGMVYPDFAAARGEPPDPLWVRSCDVVCGIDPGMAGGGAVWVAFDVENNGVVFAERFFSGMDVAQCVDAMDEVNAAWGLQTRAEKGHHVHYVIDPSARARGITQKNTIESEFNGCGVYPQIGENDRQAGAFQIRRRIRQKKLVWSSDLARVPWEAKRYRVEPRADGKWDVVKEHDHVMDAMRYAFMSRPYSTPVSLRDKPKDSELAYPPYLETRNRARVGDRGPLE